MTNSFSVVKEGLSRVDFTGQFFTSATGTRDGTIKAVRGGVLLDDDQGSQTDIIQIEFQGSNLSKDRSSFDKIFQSGSPLSIFGALLNGDDGVVGSINSDELRGFRSDDTMLGGAGNDSLKGGGGKDVIGGGTGADNVNGGSGDDIVRGNSGFDVVIGGAGDDLLFGGGGRDTIRAGSGDDTINGNGGADVIVGGSGDNVIDGGKGRDSIDAGAGDDTVRSDNGADTIKGGEGDDQLTGGARGDTFVFSSNSGDDVITDYEDNLDKIQIDGIFAFVDIDIDQDGADAVISFGAATITLLNQDATELTETDFLF